MNQPSVIMVAVCSLIAACAADDAGTNGQGGGDVAADTSGDSSSADSGREPDSPSGTDPSTGDANTRDVAGEPIASGYDCDSPHPSWLFCEDFEAGAGDFDAWFAASDFVEALGGDDRGRMRLDDGLARGGDWSMYYPAAAESGYEGADLIWYACDGEQQTNCPLRSYDRLYFRAWLRMAEDHRYVHHFLAIDGSQPDDFWYHGTAGCMPDGELHMGTTLDLRTDTHNTFFYTYFPGMACDTQCERYADVESICDGCADRGLPTCDEQPQCCWGNNYEPEPAVSLPVDQWVCVEMMMQANAPGVADGEMTYWVDGQLGHHVDGLPFRDSPSLALNRVRLEHYITTSDAAGFSNRIWFDDVVVSTERIGCGVRP